MASELRRLIWDTEAQHALVALAVKRGSDLIPMDMITYVLFHQSAAVDAVEVVRCKDCAHCLSLSNKYADAITCTYWHIDPEPDHFCGNGERRTNGS